MARRKASRGHFEGTAIQSAIAVRRTPALLLFRQPRITVAAVPEVEGVMSGPDGRTLAWVEGGAHDGYPVFGLHGTPGCRYSRMLDESAYVDAGNRYITTDRAGYGLASRNRGRTVATEAADVLAVADRLDLDQFSIVGGSGGGPHALACAALLGSRVERVACQSSLAPLGSGGLTRTDWLAGMDPEIAAELAWAEGGEEVLTRKLEEAQVLMAQRLEDEPGRLMGSEAPDSDVAFLQRPEVIAAFRRIVREQARQGVGGSVDDTLAFTSAWGFSVRDVEVPVLLTYGTEDTSCPVAHGRFLARELPIVQVHEVAGEGHFARDPQREVLATHRWLRHGGDWKYE
jgi:pimeloyl-ACP methyl ester carboxylesterase